MEMQHSATKQTSTKVITRIPQIINRITQGQSIPEIAGEMTLHRSSIHRNLATPEAQTVINQLIMEQLDIADKWLDSESSNERLEALRERGRMIRSLIPRLNLSISQSQQTIEVINRRKREMVRTNLSRLNPTQLRQLTTIIKTLNPSPTN